MTGDSANFKDALNSGRISTASFWLGPSLDWRSPQRSLMGFLCSNSLVKTKPRLAGNQIPFGEKKN